ncbi:MAG: hypothetical protein Q4A55_00555 [Aerococcus sp.]|nr:hypothetical protein [Aerococcus sp.]
MRKTQLAQLKSILQEYPQTPRILAEIREKIFNPYIEEDTNIGGSRGQLNPDKDVNKILTIADNRRFKRLTLNAEGVKYTLEQSPEWVQELIKLMYFKRSPMGITKACDFVACNYRTAKKYHDDFLERLADQLGI